MTIRRQSRRSVTAVRAHRCGCLCDAVTVILLLLDILIFLRYTYCVVYLKHNETPEVWIQLAPSCPPKAGRPDFTY